MRVRIDPHTVTLQASKADTYDWAHRAGESWPGSTLSNKRMTASFDSNGLYDFTVNGRDAVDIDGTELSALCADLIGTKLTRDHPAWDVVVGQFQE